MLAGLIFDAEGKRLTPSHAVKRGKRYRYYVSRSLITDPGISSAVAAWRLPAAELERLVINQIRDLLGDQNRIWSLLRSAKLPNHSAHALRQASKLAQDLPQIDSRAILLRLIRKVVVHDDRVETEISVTELINQLLQGRRLGTDDHGDRSPNERESTVVLTSNFRHVRRGIETRLVIEDQRASKEYRPDPVLVAALVKAHVWWSELCAGGARTIKEIAIRENSDERYVARILKLAFLAPDVTAAILEGRQPQALSANGLIKMARLPCSWALQRQRLVGAG